MTTELIPPHPTTKDFLEIFLKLIFEAIRKEQVVHTQEKKKKFVEKNLNFLQKMVTLLNVLHKILMSSFLMI